MDVEQLFRLKGLLESAMPEASHRPGQAEAEAWPRVRAEVAVAIADRADLHVEFGRLFPEALATQGRPWGAQGAEAVALMRQLAGWIGGLIDFAVLDRRIRAEATGRVRPDPSPG